MVAQITLLDLLHFCFLPSICIFDMFGHRNYVTETHPMEKMSESVIKNLAELDALSVVQLRLWLR